MTALTSFLEPEAIAFRVDAHSKKHAIQEVATLAAQRTGVAERAVFDTLLQRERLGSTGVGNGVAIPHGKLVDLNALTGVFLTLSEPVAFDAIDDQPVDLIFALLAPEDAGADHLKALAKIARVMRQPGMPDELREATSADHLFEIMTKAPAKAE